MTAEPAKEPARVVRATDEHAEIMAEFFRQVWDPHATAASVRAGRAADAAANPAVRDGDTPTYLFLRGDHALGYVTTIPVRLWVDGAEQIAYWVKGHMVLPQHRNGPVGMLLAKELVRRQDPLLAITVPRNSQRVYEALGFRSYGTLSTAIRILDPVGVLRRLNIDALGISGVPTPLVALVRGVQRAGLSGIAGTAARAAAAAWTSVVAPSARKIRVVSGDDPAASDLDALWLRVRGQATAWVVRDAAALTYRYRGAQRAMYSPIAAYGRNNELLGVAYLRHPGDADDPRLGGAKVATVSDLVCDTARGDVMSALLAGAERAARALGAHAVISMANVPRLNGVLRSRAWIPMPGTLYFFSRNVPPVLGLPADLGGWWLTRGDGGSDGGL